MKIVGNNVNSLLNYIRELIFDEDWVTNCDIQNEIDLRIDTLKSYVLETDEQIIFDKYVNVFGALKIIVPLQQSKRNLVLSPEFKVVILTQPQQLKNLQSICDLWSRKADLKQSIARAKVANISKEKMQIVFDSSRVLASICDGMFEKKYTVYLACSSHDGKPRGVALVQHASMGSVISYLATNPDHLPILGSEKEIIKGTGTALVVQIAKNILENREFVGKNLFVEPLDSCQKFYEKLGFRRRAPEESKYKDEVYFDLSEFGMKKLAQLQGSV